MPQEAAMAAAQENGEDLKMASSRKETERRLIELEIRDSFFIFSTSL